MVTACFLVKSMMLDWRELHQGRRSQDMSDL